MVAPAQVVVGLSRDGWDWLALGSTVVAAVVGLVAVFIALRAAHAAQRATEAAHETARLAREQADLLRAEGLRQEWLREEERLLRILAASLDLADAVNHQQHDRNPILLAERRLRAALAARGGDDLSACRVAADSPAQAVPSIGRAMKAVDEVQVALGEHQSHRPQAQADPGTEPGGHNVLA